MVNILNVLSELMLALDAVDKYCLSTLSPISFRVLVYVSLLTVLSSRLHRCSPLDHTLTSSGLTQSEPR